MSNGSNRIFDDLAKLATDAAGAAQGVRQEVESAFRAQAERAVNKLDLVSKEEFEVVKALAVKALDANEALQKRVKILEEKLDLANKA
ncbi:accessory factor UbiK family protein [Bartonella sp. HY329]|uniref:accessory factor UbiK family protein n=1 Tax=unclassified Bartonella TaxID=2645622 RepID=UPI0021C9D940|nr:MULTISPECIES: accessory factor UbiK family protein [unclassified Bartonella]UXM95009.1 accessory factor UbiK family protein [Bartonella sp. HY329]UXN09332.1 accessory factor UbiK family protein [Bartonella sp. HY328]